MMNEIMKDSDENKIIGEKEMNEIMKDSDENKIIEEKETSNIVVFDFMADWCGPCKIQDPVIEEMKKKFEGKAEFKKIDVDKNGELADKYKVMAIPTLIIEKDGKIFKRIVGLTRSQDLENAINESMK
jgi:thioredoxin 1